MRDIDIELGRIREQLRVVSREVFGKQYRLEVAAMAGAVEAPIWSRQISQLLALPENQVASEITKFASLGALQQFPIAHDRRKTYQAVPHPLWPFTRALLERTILIADPEEGQVTIAQFWSSLLDGKQPKAVPE